MDDFRFPKKNIHSMKLTFNNPIIFQIPVSIGNNGNVSATTLILKRSLTIPRMKAIMASLCHGRTENDSKTSIALIKKVFRKFYFQLHSLKDA